MTELIGHFACTNPLHAALTRDPKAVILFKGPDAYLSPAHAGRRDWGPTWNYAPLRVWADITVDESLTRPAIDLLATLPDVDLIETVIHNDINKSLCVVDE
ncbi:FMN-binding negative transcriptional regulator [Niveispirillum sp.]|uniref:FMN-binding negative transcriptional regulator n=1 Tax=Niveispirillum sp. TaxID=1917217 RepID=UPI001B7CD7C7|nr:FMN-binding negative transcriptional regulator [Niveispirillum sp.]MBP7337104.1 FMN-binding negative transcriptional regulator [Niveispirillum sp.]